jgi:hypothetical protein
VNGERLGCEQAATPHLIVAASAYTSLVRCSRPKESPQFDENIENSVVWRMVFFMLIVPRSADQDGYAPYATVLDGFVELGRFLRQRASPE